MRRRWVWSIRILVVATALLANVSPASADEPAVRGTVAPGDLVIQTVYFEYPYEGCYDAFPTAEAEAWYEDIDAVRIPGSDFTPIVSRRTTSADVGFYVKDDAVDGFVVLDLYVVYSDCPDGSVLRKHQGLYRWIVDTSLAHETVPLPAGGAVGILGLVVLSAAPFWVVQRNSTKRW